MFLPLSGALLSALLLAQTPVDRTEGSLAGLALAALEQQQQATDRRVEVAHVEPLRKEGCTPERATVHTAVTRSGRYALTLTGTERSGRPCHATTWLFLRVYRQSWVVRADVPEGAVLAKVTEPVEHEVTATQPGYPSLPEGARAKRALRAGTWLRPQDWAVDGPKPGDAVRAIWASGALQVEQTATVIPCLGEGICARVGTRGLVRGRMEGGKLWVERGP